MLPHHLAFEMVVTRGNCGVRSKYVAGRHDFERAREVETGLDITADALEHEECGMSLVHVPHGRLDPHRPERTHAADAKDDFLLDARRTVTAIQPVGDDAVALGVLRNVGIEQVQPYVSGTCAPDAHLDIAPGQLDRHPHLVAVGSHDLLERQVGEVRCSIGRVLVAVGVDGLRKVALAVQQAHRHQRQPHIARRLAVVPGEDAQPARIDRQALVKAEFGAEIRDQIVVLQSLCAVARRRRFVIRVVGRQDAVEIRKE